MINESLKVIVTPNESERIQNILFKLGYSWGGKEGVQNVKGRVLFIHKNDVHITYMNSYCNYSKNQSNKLVTPSYFDKYETPLWRTLNG